MSDDLPDCGLYRAGVSLPGHDDDVPSGCLVYFHNHSDAGPPIVLTPHDNTHNRWTFHDSGWLVEDPGFIGALIPLKQEGLYVIKGHHLHISDEEIIPELTLVQLGYNRKADSILFTAQFDENKISFPERGYLFENPNVQEVLTSVTFKIPTSDSSRTLH